MRWLALAALLLAAPAWADSGQMLHGNVAGGRSAILTPAEVVQAGELLKRLDALKAMLAKKHEVYRGLTSGTVAIYGGMAPAYQSSQTCKDGEFVKVLKDGSVGCHDPPEPYAVPCDDQDTEKQCIATKPKPPEPPKPPPVYEVNTLTITQDRNGWSDCSNGVFYSQPCVDHGPPHLELDATEAIDILNMLIARVEEKLKVLGVRP